MKSRHQWIGLRRIAGVIATSSLVACGQLPKSLATAAAPPTKSLLPARSGTAPGAVDAPMRPGESPSRTGPSVPGNEVPIPPEALREDRSNLPEASPLDAHSFPAGGGMGSDGLGFRVPGRLLVAYKMDIPLRPTGLLATLRKLRTMRAIGTHLVELQPGTEATTTLALENDPAVEFVERDYRMRADGIWDSAAKIFGKPKAPPPILPALIPNDPGFGQQWGLLKISAPNAWGVTTGTPNVKIAILDSGIDLDHEDLQAKVVVNRNFSESSTADDLYGHGTHVAGIAASITNNGVGVAGAGFNAALMNVKVMADDGYVDLSVACQGIIWAAENGASVLNMSFASPTYSKTLHNAIRFAARRRLVLVGGSGNTGTTQKFYPAAHPEVIAVAATDQADQRAAFSNYGAKWVDVAAPGVDVYSTGPNHANPLGLHSYGALSGTSMSTAFVSGEAALLLSNGAYSSVRRRIERNTDTVPGQGTFYRYGRINMSRAVVAR